MTIDETWERAEGVIATLDRLHLSGVLSDADYVRRLRDLHFWLDIELDKHEPPETP